MKKYMLINLIIIFAMFNTSIYAVDCKNNQDCPSQVEKLMSLLVEGIHLKYDPAISAC